MCQSRIHVCPIHKGIISYGLPLREAPSKDITLCMCLTLRRKNGSGSQLPQVTYLTKSAWCGEKDKSNGRFRRITYENPLWIITMESSERITPKPISLNPAYLKARVRSHLSALTGVQISAWWWTYVSSGQIMPSSSRSKNATCDWRAVFFAPGSNPVPGAVETPSFGATISCLAGCFSRVSVIARVLSVLA